MFSFHVGTILTNKFRFQSESKCLFYIYFQKWLKIKITLLCITDMKINIVALVSKIIQHY